MSSRYGLEFLEGKQPVCISGLRAVMMFLGRVVWSVLVVNWSTSLLVSSFGFTVLDVGVFIFLISRQICVDLSSASLLHHMSHFMEKSCLFVACWQR